jgi:hypothetical protein
MRRVICLMLLIRSNVLWGQATTIPTIEILLYADAKLSAGVLLRAQSQAAEMFARAGVGTRWIQCTRLSEGSPECRSPAAAHRLVIQFAPTKGSPARLRDVLGSTVVTADTTGFNQRATVFWERIEGLANAHRIDPALLLGAAIGHEIGHLLLQERGHTASGIMTADLRGKELTALAQRRVRFSKEQADVLRLNVMRRVRKAATGPLDPPKEPSVTNN